MEKSKSLDAIALEALRGRITKVLPEQIRACVEELNEEQIWWRPNDGCNSVGNLIIHLSGSMRHYLSREIGGMEYTRNRPAEFAERGPIPKEELLSIFDETIAQANAILSSFDTARFTEQTAEPDYYPNIFTQILGIAIHLATHTGQIIYITKMLKEGSIKELWSATHKKNPASRS